MFNKNLTVWNLKDFFTEPFFETKKILSTCLFPDFFEKKQLTGFYISKKYYICSLKSGSVSIINIF